MFKFKAIILVLVFGIGSILGFSIFVFLNSNEIARRIRNPDTQIKVFQDSEGNFAALVIPEGAYKEQGFHVPREIPMEALLQVGVNIRARGDNSFNVTEEGVYKGHVHTPIDNPRREMFIIKEGVAKLTFYTKDGIAVKEKILFPGDVAFITEGHSVEFLTDCKVIEIKEGPYPGTPEEDKVWLETSGRPALDGLNFAGLATSIKEDGKFMNPLEILRLAVKNNFVGPVQVYLDEQAMKKLQELKAFAEENNIPLLVHSFLGIKELSEQELREEMEATFDLLEGEDVKRVVFHFAPRWQKKELINYIEKFNQFGLVPGIENPVGDFNTYQDYISMLEDIASRSDLKFDLVIDVGNLYTNESSLGQVHARRFLNEMLKVAQKNKKNIIVHLLDSTNPDFSQREHWVPVDKGLIPYEDVIDTLSAYSGIIHSTIFEYEDINNTLQGRDNWLNLVRSKEDRSFIFGPKSFLGAFLSSSVSGFDPSGLTEIELPVQITKVNEAQVVKWENHGYEIIHVKTGSITVDLTIDGEMKTVTLNQGDTILITPGANVRYSWLNELGGSDD